MRKKKNNKLPLLNVIKLIIFIAFAFISKFAYSDQLLRLQILREPSPIVFTDKGIEVFNPVFESTNDMGHDTVFDWLAHPLVVEVPDGTKYPLKHFKGILPTNISQNDFKHLQVELINSSNNSITNINLPECVEKNLLELIQVGVNEVCKRMISSAVDYSSCMNNIFVCHQFAQYLTLDNKLTMHARFSFLEKFTSKLKLATDSHSFRISVARNGIEFYLQFKGASYLAKELKFNYKKIQPGTRLFFYDSMNAEPESLVHSGIYLTDNFFLSKDGFGNVFAMTIDEYLNRWPDIDMAIEAVVPSDTSYYCQ